MNSHTSQNTKGEPITPETIPTATAARAHTEAITMRFASTRCSTPRGNRLRPKRSRPQPHTQGTYPSSPPAATLHGTNSRFRAPASSHTQVSCTVHVAISMRFAAPRTHPCSHYNAIRIPALQNTKGEHDPNRNRCTQEVPFTAACSHPTRKNTRFRARASSPCSHCTHTHNAFCSTTCTSMQPLQCDLHPHVAEHQGRTDYARNDPDRNRTHKVPFIAACSHVARKNSRFRAPASSPTPLQCVLQHHVHSMQPLQCDSHPRGAEHQGRTDYALT